MAYKLGTAGRNAGADAILALLNGGTIKVYTGTQPANPQTAISGNTLLGTLGFSATAFAAASSGVATANAITEDSSADNAGTASWARLLKSDGTTAVMDIGISATGGGGDLQLNTVTIVAGGPIRVSSMTYTVPE